MGHRFKSMAREIRIPMSRKRGETWGIHFLFHNSDLCPLLDNISQKRTPTRAIGLNLAA
jgi:hypothetical protein